MSAANLLGDLDSFYNPGSQATPQSHSSQRVQDGSTQYLADRGNLRASNTPARNSWDQSSAIRQFSNSNDDDDWGEFESGTFQAVDQSTTHPEASVDPWELGKPTDKSEKQSTVNENRFRNQKPHHSDIQTPFHKLDEQQSSPTKTSRATSKPLKAPRDENVIFDVEYDFDDDDEFGEFEDISISQSQPPQFKVTMMPIEQRRPITEIKKSSPTPLQNSLIDFDWDSDTADFDTSVLSPTNRYTTHFEAPTSNWQPNPVKAKFTPPISQPPRTLEVTDDNEDWDDFTEAKASPEPSVVNAGNTMYKTGSSSPPRAAPIDVPELLPCNDTRSSVAAPSNIPPPAVLLPLFPPSFFVAQKQLFEPLSQYTNMPSMKLAILSHPATERFLESYLVIASVLGHVIAGRKLRWKRDGLLSQSMSIGPASTSGKSAGMKLTSVDKTENAREERELADVLKSWRIQVGKLRSAITGSNPQAKIPELSEVLPVKTATQAEGGITSLRQCALCGLRRNERVPKVDFDVQDAFGEWWTEHWGHRACRNFWDSQKQQLHVR